MWVYRYRTALLAAVLALAGCAGAPAAPPVWLIGEAQHIWVGRPSGECAFGFAAYRQPDGGPALAQVWSGQHTLTDGAFRLAVPPGVLDAAELRWVELTVRCPALEAGDVVMTPRVAVQARAPDAARIDPSAYLCVAPAGATHQEIALRSHAYTIYVRFQAA